jgi:hypothetical protein
MWSLRNRAQICHYSTAVLGLCSGYARAMLGLCSGYAWAMLGLCSGYARAILGLFSGYSRAMLGLCSGYSRAMLWLYSGYARAMLGLCSGYARAMLGLYSAVLRLYSDFVCLGCSLAISDYKWERLRLVQAIIRITQGISGRVSILLRLVWPWMKQARTRWARRHVLADHV